MDGDRDTDRSYHATFEPGTRPPSEVIVETIASIEGTSATRTGFVLYDYIDPDALDELFTKARGSATVEFAIGENQIRVEDDGSIVIERSSAKR